VFQAIGNVYATNQVLAPSNSTVTVPAFAFKEDSNTGIYHPSAGQIGITTSGVSRMIINNLGYVGVGISNPSYPIHVATNSNNISIYASYDIAAFSDERIKMDVRKVDDALAKLTRISGYTYLRKDNPQQEKRSAGVLAQEVQRVFPEVVHEDPDTGLMSVAYGNMAALFVEAIKELKEEKDNEIQELRSRIKTLENI
jgi:hypothetical protein